MPEQIKLIAIDVDRTLILPDGSVSEGNRAAIRRAQQAGILVTLCTARMPRAAGMIARRAGIEGPLICCNGGCVGTPEEIWFSRPISPEAVSETLQILDATGLPYHVLTPYQVYGNEFAAMESYIKQWHCDERGLDSSPATVMQTGAAIAEAVGYRAVRVIVVDERRDAQRLAGVRERLRAVQGLSVTSSWPDNVEIHAANCDKGTGLATLCKLLDIPEKAAMAIGDSEQDVLAFEHAGWSVAMGNANQAVRERADAVTKDYAEDGVAQAIARYALKEESI